MKDLETSHRRRVHTKRMITLMVSGLLWTTGTLFAQTEVYKCGSTFTNDKEEAKAKGCVKMEKDVPPVKPGISASPLGAEWEMIAQNGANQVFLHRPSVLPQEGYLKAWTVAVYPAGGSLNGLAYRSTHTLAYYNCKRMTVARKLTTYHPDTAAQSPAILQDAVEELALNFGRALPGSVEQAALKAVCTRH